MPSFADACAHEIESLHDFFEHWFRGAFADRVRAFERFSDVLAPGFVIVSPRGVATPRGALLEGLSSAFAAWASDDPKGTIMVDSITPRHVHGDLALLTYIERQKRPAGSTARLSTVLMQRHEGTPNGVCWMHVHETWLPGEAPPT